jgi:hypothetical protein
LNSKEKRQLETELVKMGLAGLASNGDPSPELVQQIAAIVNNWPGATNRHGEWIDKHKYLRDLFGECDQADRSDMYMALVPHLKFKVKSLSHYETMLAERIGNLVSKRAASVTGDKPKPIEVGNSKYAAAPKAIATHAIATLRCHRCPKTEQFVADTPAGAMIAARTAGWTREAGINKEACPDCSTAVAETVIRLSRTETLAVYDRRAGRLDALD